MGDKPFVVNNVLGPKIALKSNNIEEGVIHVIRELTIQNDLSQKMSMVRENINDVNAEFYKRLIDEFKEITKSERELCAHLKLGLSNKEIANIKNSTENSVNVSKARLRKKLGFDTNKELQHYLFNF